MKVRRKPSMFQHWFKWQMEATYLIHWHYGLLSPTNSEQMSTATFLIACNNQLIAG